LAFDIEVALQRRRKLRETAEKPPRREALLMFLKGRYFWGSAHVRISSWDPS
jgi:hypothetical protein